FEIGGGHVSRWHGDGIQLESQGDKAEVTFVLHRFCARWLPEFAIAEIGVDFRGLGGAVGPGVNLDDVEVDSASRSDRRISIDQDKVDNWTGSCISPIQACLVGMKAKRATAAFI